MKTTKLTGKDISNFLARFQSWAEKQQIPDYVNETRWEDGKRKLVTTPAGIAQRFNDLLTMIQETSATVKISQDHIGIEYSNGRAKMGRDILIDTFLIPTLHTVCPHERIQTA